MQPVDNLPEIDLEAIYFTLIVAFPKQIECLLYNFKKADLDRFCKILSHIP